MHHNISCVINKLEAKLETHKDYLYKIKKGLLHDRSFINRPDIKTTWLK